MTPWLVIIFVSWYALHIQACNFDMYRSWAQRRLTTIGHNFREPCRALSGGFNESKSLHSRSIKVFLFQNNERELLADWLQYHSYLFGSNNLHIVDHLSTDTSICKLLALYSLCGTKLTSYDKAFEKKHAILTKVMREETKTFLVPLDADEFVVFATNEERNHVSFDRERILSTFQELPIDGRKYKFNQVLPVRLNNATCERAEQYSEQVSGAYRRVMNTGYTGESMWRAPISKSFYHTTGFRGTDQGNHFGHAGIDGPGGGASNLTHFIIANTSIIHLGVSTYDSIKQKALRGAAAYGYKSDTNCSAISSGRHYCQRAKLFHTKSAESTDLYRNDCQAHAADRPFSTMQEWFSTHALTLEQLVGNGQGDGDTVKETRAMPGKEKKTSHAKKKVSGK